MKNFETMNSNFCPYCNSEKILRKSGLISSLNKKSYDLFFCTTCLLEFFTPLKFEDVYQTEKNESYIEFHSGRRFFPEWTKEMIRFFKRINFQFFDGIKILEIGAGDGINFLALKQSFNISSENYFAVELDKKSVEVCKRRGIKNVIQEYFDGSIIPMMKHKFDFILITEVLEHQIEPKEFLSTAFSLLNESGSLIVTVPNRRRAFINSRSADGDVPPHHFLRFDRNFFRKNFGKQVSFMKEYSFSNKTLIASSEALCDHLFKSKRFFFLMLPAAVLLRMIDTLHGEGILVVISKKNHVEK